MAEGGFGSGDAQGGHGGWAQGNPFGEWCDGDIDGEAEVLEARASLAREAWMIEHTSGGGGARGS